MNVGPNMEVLAAETGEAIPELPDPSPVKGVRKVTKGESTQTSLFDT